MSENDNFNSSSHSSLLLGATLLAFAPTVSLFFSVVYNEAKLVIIVTTSAFAYLCSALISALAYMAIPIFYDRALWMIVPSVFFQALARVQFVKYYMKVEAAILQSMSNSSFNSSESRNGEDRNIPNHSNTNNNNNNNSSSSLHHPTLALNDWSSGLAAGVGYGFMHAVMLCGTLIASEGGDDVGTLYQDSCPDIPSVLNTAAIAMLFSILDIILMFFYFYAVRRKLQRNISTGVSIHSHYNKPNTVLAIAMGAHLAAGLVSMFNDFTNGCYFALPSLALIVFGTGLYFSRFLLPTYLPSVQKEQLYHQHES